VGYQGNAVIRKDVNDMAQFDKFEVGVNYRLHEYEFEVVKRTDKTIWIQPNLFLGTRKNKDGGVAMKRIKMYGDEEVVEFSKHDFWTYHCDDVCIGAHHRADYYYDIKKGEYVKISPSTNFLE
jgi:hypothetical protein